MSDVRLRNPNPSDRDALGGAHGRIAAAIASLIDSCPGGKSLAIMGGWGSGKSTIVSLLRKQLHPIATRVFLFDAWSHQGDPIRRSFLESFFEFLAAEDWLQKDAPFGNLTLQDEVRRTTGRSDIVTTKTRKALGPWGVAAAIVTLFSAGAINILPKWDPTKTQPNHTFLWIDVTLVALPFLVFLAAWVRGRSASRSFMELLVKDAEEEKTVETAKTLDSTSIDFRRLFCALCSRALEPAHRRLVIVIDNLDRIDPAEALTMWASMRTFFDFTDAPKLAAAQEWISRVWLIVPLDRGALQRLWKQDEPKATQKLIDAFVAKTFDLVYDIPNVTLTRQKQFFQDELRDAIPGQDAAAYDCVYLLADRYRTKLSTPREIKLFVNRLASLHLQWQGEITLPLLALHALVPEALNQTIPPAVLDLLDDKQRDQWQAAIAAIQFNVPLEDAGEAIDGPRILQALETGKPISEDLHKRKWFWEVCARVVRDRTTEWEAGPDLLANSICSLNGLAQPAAPADAALAAQIWDSIADTANRSSAWKIGVHFVDAILLLHSRSNQTDAAKLRQKLLDTAQLGVPPDNTGGKLFDDWVRGVFQFCERLPSIPADYSIELADQWPQAMLTTGSLPYVQRFRPADSRHALRSLAELGFQGVGLEGDFLFILIGAMKSSGQWPWTELANAETPWNRGGFALDPVARAVRILLEADPNAGQPDYSPFRQLREDPGKLVALIAEAQSANRHADAARLTFALITNDIDPAAISALKLAAETIPALQELLDRTGRFDLAVTLALMDHPATKEAGRLIVANLVDAGRGSELMPVADRGISAASRLLSLMADLDNALAAQLVKAPAFADRLSANLAGLADDTNWLAIRLMFDIESFPGREHLLQEILKVASRETRFGSSLLLALFNIAGTTWLPVSVARDLQAIHVSASGEPELYNLLTRRIAIGLQTTDQLLAAASSDPNLYDSAIDHAQSDAALNPDDPAAHLAWGRALAAKAAQQKGAERKSTLSHAEKRFRRAVGLDAASAEARKSLAETLLASGGGRAALDEAIANLDGLDEPLLSGRAFLARAQLYIGPDLPAEIDAAIAHFRIAFAAEPANIDAQAGLAAALSDKAQRSTGEDARQLYEDARQQFAAISSPTPEVLVQFGRALLAESKAGPA